MNDYIEKYLSDNLDPSHIFDENNRPFVNADRLYLTMDGVLIRKLFISNLAERTTYKDLTKLFSKYGEVESCYLRRNQGKNNYAFVTFNSVEAAVRVRYMERLRLHKRELVIKPADSWHQPDNIENQYYSSKDKSKSDKKACNEQYNQDFVQNDITDSSIQTLNDDCLAHIFLQLPILDRIRIERVCKRWRALSQESWRNVKRLDLSFSMWGSLPGSEEGEIYTSTLRKVLLRCGPYLNEIDLSEKSHPFSQSTLTIVGKLCPNLQRIDVTGFTVSASGINSLIKNCHNITKFSLGSTTHICDIYLELLFKVNPKLRYFKIASDIRGRCLIHLPLETMEEIVLENCSSLQGHFLSRAFAKLQNLKSLTLHNSVNVHGNVIQAIGTHCTNLKILELSDVSFIMQSENILHISQLTNLEVLKISKNLAVRDELLSNLASKCLQLKYLDISECPLVSNNGVAAIATLPKLEVLIMNDMPSVTDMCLRDSCNLKKLECQVCQFTDKTMTEIIESAPRLELLDLSKCRRITSKTLKRAAAVTINRTNNTILKIFIGGTSVDLTKLDKVSPYLQVVNIDLCKTKENNLAPLVLM